MTSVVYFISDGAGAIKIGFTTELDVRVGRLQSANARGLSIIAAIPGTRSQERLVHLALADARMSGEWFADTTAVRALIARVCDVGLSAAGFPPEDPKPNDLSTLAEAKRLAEIIIRCTGASVTDGPEQICGVSRALLWKLRYRPGRDIWADELTALRSAALRAADVSIRRAEEDRAWVIGICDAAAARDQRFDWFDAVLRQAAGEVHAVVDQER